MLKSSRSNSFLRQIILSIVGFKAIAMFLLMFVASGVLSGVIRYFTSWNPDFSLVVSIVLCAIVFSSFIYLSRQTPLPPLSKIFALLFCGAALVTYSFYCLYNIFFDGFVSLGSPDAGNHVQLSRIFFNSDPKTYNGFIGLYSYVFLLQKLGFDTFESFTLAFYTVVALVASAPFFFLALRANTGLESPKKYWTEAVGVLLFSLPVFYRILLPSLHYNQGDGFWAHLFGLIPLILICLSYGLFSNVFVRLAALVFGIVVYRFVYGLNLGDMILTVGILLFWESYKDNTVRRWRNLLLSMAILLAGGSLFAFTKLYVLNDVTGAIVPPKIFNSLLGQSLTVGVFGLYCLLTPTIASSFSRIIRFAAVFIAINLVVQWAYLIAGLPQLYYFQKYNFHAVFLGCLVLIPILADLFERTISIVLLIIKKQKLSLQAIKKSNLYLFISIVICVSALSEMNKAHNTYKDSFRERLWGKPSTWTYNSPLVDRKAEKIISDWLQDENKTFGGLIVCNYSIVNFMNASFGYNRGIELLRKGRDLPTTNQCVFWFDNEIAIGALAHHKEKGTIQSYDAVMSWKKHERTRCVSYIPKHDLTEQRLCGLCL